MTAVISAILHPRPALQLNEPAEASLVLQPSVKLQLQSESECAVYRMVVDARRRWIVESWRKVALGGRTAVDEFESEVVAGASVSPLQMRLTAASQRDTCDLGQLS